MHCAAAASGSQAQVSHFLPPPLSPASSAHCPAQCLLIHTLALVPSPKTLRELEQELGKAEDDAIGQVLPHWPRLYNRLSTVCGMGGLPPTRPGVVPPPHPKSQPCPLLCATGRRPPRQGVYAASVAFSRDQGQEAAGASAKERHGVRDRLLVLHCFPPSFLPWHPSPLTSFSTMLQQLALRHVRPAPGRCENGGRRL